MIRAGEETSSLINFFQAILLAYLLLVVTLLCDTSAHTHTILAPMYVWTDGATS